MLRNERLEKYISGLTVIDTHEHLPPESDLGDMDIFDLLWAYVPDSAKAAGMPLGEYFAVADKSLPLEERFSLFIRYYPHIKTHTFYKVFEASVRRLYGFSAMTVEEAARVNALIRAEDKSSIYQRIFELCGIEKALTFVSFDETEKFAGQLLTPVPTLSDMSIRSVRDLVRIEAYSGIKISLFDDLLEAIDIMFKKYAALGIKNIKFASGNRRTLDYRARTKACAEEVFNSIMDMRITGEHYVGRLEYPVMPFEQTIPLDDYLITYMVTLAGKYGMNVNFHISTHVWNYNSVQACHAQPLEWLINRFKNINFVLLHCSMPFIDEAVLLARYFPNVYLNLTWCHIIDRLQTIELIKKCATMLPLNKIHAFGGDYLYPQTIAGHLDCARDNMTVALSQLIGLGMIDEGEAEEIAYAWFYKNPNEFYL